MANKNHQPTAFISYAREDSVSVKTLYNYLSRRGFRPWLDIEDILPGQTWKDVLLSAIRNAEFFIACLSTNSVGKRGVIQEEIKEALDIWRQKLPEDIYFIPVRLEICDVPAQLKRFQWVDLFENGGFEKLAVALVEGARRLGFQPPADYAESAGQSSAHIAKTTLEHWGIMREVKEYESEFLSLARVVYGVLKRALKSSEKVTSSEFEEFFSNSSSLSHDYMAIDPG